MFRRMSLRKNGTNLKLATANIILVANAFIWYLIAFNGLKSLLTQQGASDTFTLLIVGINTGAIIVSGLLGTLLVDKIKNRRAFLYFWLAGGIVLSIIPLGLNVSSATEIAVVAVIFGAYFGVGMPATMGYHVSFSAVEGRAKIGGLTFLIIGVIFAIAGLTVLNSILTICLILVALRIVGLAIFHFMPIRETLQEPHKETIKVKYRSIISNKPFLLYFIPWCMFTLINFLTIPIQSKIYPTDSTMDYSAFLRVMENVVVALVAVISGFVADRWGRKRLTMIGFIMLGIGYAVIGLSYNPNSVNSTNMLLPSIIFTITDGTAWGIFYVLFLFTLWGDLAQNRNSDKFYFLGALPYISSYFMQLMFTPFLKQEISATTIFSFASVFLFLAVLPLVYAPETLPEKHMKDRDLKTYIEKAQKIAQKEEGIKKKQKKNKPHEEAEDEKPAEETSEEYKKAKELAEKYY